MLLIFSFFLGCRHDAGSLFLCLLLRFLSAGEYAGARFLSLCFGFRNLMCVDIGGRGCVGVSELSRRCNQINAVCNHRGSGGVPECVRVDVRQSMRLAEFPQPIGHAVRVDRQTVVLCEYISGISPPVAVGKLKPMLCCSMLFEQSEGFRCNA